MWFHHMFFPLMYSRDTQKKKQVLAFIHTWTCPYPSVGQCTGISEWYSMGTQIQQLTSYPVLHM